MCHRNRPLPLTEVPASGIHCIPSHPDNATVLNSHVSVLMRLIIPLTQMGKLLTLEVRSKVPSGVTISWIYFLLLFFPLHVSTLSGHLQKESWKPLAYQRHPIISSPIPRVILLHKRGIVHLALIHYNYSSFLLGNCSFDIFTIDNNQHDM
jgi:hypothetical protein